MINWFGEFGGKQYNAAAENIDDHAQVLHTFKHAAYRAATKKIIIRKIYHSGDILVEFEKSWPEFDTATEKLYVVIAREEEDPVLNMAEDFAEKYAKTLRNKILEFKV